MHSDPFPTLSARRTALPLQLAEAVEAEKYDEAAALRDRLRQLEEAAAAAADVASQYLCPVDEPRFTLGEMVVHSSKGYRGVICGWDMTCCEDGEWQEAAGVRWAREREQAGRDWPGSTGAVAGCMPVAEAEEGRSTCKLGGRVSAWPMPAHGTG